MTARLKALVFPLLLMIAGCEDDTDFPMPVAVRYESAATSSDVRFVPVAIALDAGEQRIAAYQVELDVVAGQAEIVGVEGSEEIGFTEPPHYDPAALSGGRIILGAFNTERALPKGKQRVAIVHMREKGSTKVVYELTPVVCANLNGETINARAFVSGKGGEEQ